MIFVRFIARITGAREWTTIDVVHQIGRVFVDEPFVGCRVCLDLVDSCIAAVHVRMRLIVPAPQSSLLFIVTWCLYVSVLRINKQQVSTSSASCGNLARDRSLYCEVYSGLSVVSGCPCPFVPWTLRPLTTYQSFARRLSANFLTTYYLEQQNNWASCCRARKGVRTHVSPNNQLTVYSCVNIYRKCTY